MEQLLVDDQDNGEILTGLVYYYAMECEWEKALEVAGRFLAKSRRESAARLSVGLLVPQILYRMGRKESARQALETFMRAIKAPWYIAISKCLLGRYPVSDLVARAQARPEDSVTAHVALGFQAEADHAAATAMKHYKEALASRLSDWIEYDFARANLNRLKAAGADNS